MDSIDVCLRFYTRLIESKYKQGDLTDDDSDDEDDIKTPSTTTTETIIQPMNSLSLTNDLLSSYYNLYRQFQKSILFEENSTQQEQLQALFKIEWKKIDILQLKHDYDQLKKEHQSTDEKLVHLRDELQRIQLERDQLQREKIQMAQEIDRLKSVTPTNVIIQSDQVLTNVSNKKNIIDQLDDLLPHQITTEQAKQFIQEIYYQQTTFNISNIRKSICGSLKQLGSDLYSSSVHFLHELIQVNSIYFQTEIYSFLFVFK
jgi:predicted  nucleic acid-binding Zn-ribbon protein